MKTVWKFPLKVTDLQRILMPSGARPLSVQAQSGEPCLWALVDPSVAIWPRLIVTKGTGHPFDRVDENAAYVGTYQLNGGAFVFHVFDAGEVPRESGS